MYEAIVYQKEGAIAKILMNRPETGNAQNIKMINEIDDAMVKAENDTGVRVVVLGGVGKHFSSGHDMKGDPNDPDHQRSQELRKSIEGRTQIEQEIYFDKCMRIRNLSKPTIAQVQGACIAGSVMLACMCDIIIASEDAFFTNPVGRMCASGLELLIEPWEIGIRKAKEMLFTGDKFSAQEMCRLGMVNRVVPRDQLEAAVDELAGRIAMVPPVGLKLTKASLNHTQDLMGQRNSFEYHFLVHQIAHSTKEWADFFADTEGKSMKEVFAKRDGKFADK
ncbi:MAG: enoyl-CoA hydratase [Bacillota bacterium]